MGRYYGEKILNKEINPATGKAWKQTDVPKLWRAKTKAYIDERKAQTSLWDE